MDKQRERYVAEMDRIRLSIARTGSKYLRADYEKRLRRMQRELREYDSFRAGITA